MGGEFMVNAFTASYQEDPDVAAQGASEFVVVWTEYSYGAQIMVQLFDAEGKVGSEFGVADSGGYTYRVDASVDAAANGDFVVVWEESCAKCSSYIFGRRFGSDGGPLDDPFFIPDVPLATSAGRGAAAQLSGGSFFSASDPDVAVAPAGQFVVAWQSDEYYFSAVRVARYDDGGGWLDDFRVSSYGDFAYDPAIGVADDGAFVVVWTAPGVEDDDIFARRYDSAGESIGSQFTVNSHTTGYQYTPDVAVDAAGNFVVVWSSFGQVGPGASSDIFGQRFDASGDPVGSEFQANTYTTDYQSRPRVALEADGDFIVTWHDGGEGSGQDGSGQGVFAQRFASDGAPAGTEFQVNSYTTGYQRQPAVAALSATDFVIVWEGPDGGSDGVFGQRFGPVMP